ncbi:MAG: MBL fold metallo-hydrolase [Eubacteriales bacterium]|nr:MBL fold metallo-hydrolase [Eubacteriales bacterium]
MILASLGSGSKGNCTLISTNTENILVDCGIPEKTIVEGLRKLSLCVNDIDAILITHEHSDHISSLKKLMNKYDIPAYASYGTISNISDSDNMNFFVIQADSEFYIGNTMVTPFRTYHDTPGPLGYRLEQEAAVCGKDTAVCVLTDCGHYDEYIKSHLRNLDAMLIEANHNIDMLMTGPYPMFLKRRIFSDNGHASNISCGRLLDEIRSDRLKGVLLGHLSEVNNDPYIALKEVLTEFPPCGVKVSVAPQNGISEVITL